VAAHIEDLRQLLLDVSLRAFRANEALRQELARIPCQPFQRACLEDATTRVEWSASLQTSGYAFTVRAPVCTGSGDATRVQLSESEQDWLEVNVADIAVRLCIALRSTEGETLTQRELLAFPIPADGAAADQYEQVLTMAWSHDHERDLEAVIDQPDRLIGPALGLDDADLSVIQEQCRVDPLLSKIFPRYPYTENRRHGFRTNLDRPDRYR
jgi:hypothetical protein